ncbi:hypothetical protein EB796_001461 [Bugula neritina]|uniref:Uncharacterized protein n=1 Tax=Bugula neritina TaxID=10212 RepID=A0A7J7KQ12_BUGNE|nr:hypothetical protein EB796_001461 [Bugula neritina]
MKSFDGDREERLSLENDDEMLTNDRSYASDTSNSRSFLEDVNEEVPGQNFIERYTKLLRRLAAEEDLKKLNANAGRPTRVAGLRDPHIGEFYDREHLEPRDLYNQYDDEQVTSGDTCDEMPSFGDDTFQRKNLAPATFLGVMNSGEPYQQHDLSIPDYGDQLVSELTYSKRSSSEDSSQERRAVPRQCWTEVASTSKVNDSYGYSLSHENSSSNDYSTRERDEAAGYVWLKKETDRYLTKYTPVSPKIYYNNDGPSTSYAKVNYNNDGPSTSYAKTYYNNDGPSTLYAPPTQPVSHGIKVSPKSSFKKKLTSLGTFFKGSKKNKVFPAALSNINKQPVTTQPPKAAPPATNLSKPSPKGKALMPKRNGANVMASKFKSQANATNAVKSPLKPTKQPNQMQIKNTEPPKTNKTSITRSQPNAAKLTEKNARARPKKIKIVQTKTSKMRACRNLSLCRATDVLATPVSDNMPCMAGETAARVLIGAAEDDLTAVTGLLGSIAKYITRNSFN